MAVFLVLNMEIKNKQLNFVSFAGEESLGGGGAASLFAYLWVPGVQPQKKKSILTFLRFLKWVFEPVFSSFNNAFWFHLMTLKWNQERVRLAICPLWMSSGWGRVEYLNNNEWKFWQIYGLKRLLVRVPLQSLKLRFCTCLRSSLTFRQLQSVDSLWNAYVTL